MAFHEKTNLDMDISMMLIKVTLIMALIKAKILIITRYIKIKIFN